MLPFSASPETHPINTHQSHESHNVGDFVPVCNNNTKLMTQVKNMITIRLTMSNKNFFKVIHD